MTDQLERRSRQAGFTHIALVLALLVIVLVAYTGYRLLQGSHAASVNGPITGIGGKCLDDYANKLANNNPIDLWTCNGSAAQQWQAMSNGTIQNQGYCLGVYNGGTAPSTLVDLYACNGTAAQLWSVSAAGTLINIKSGLCLDDRAGNTADGTTIWIYTCNGSDAQKWHVTSNLGPTPTDVSINDTITGSSTNQFNYNGNWLADTSGSAAAYQANNHYTNLWGASYTVKFNGTQIKLYAERNVDIGKYGVSIDGGGETIVDGYAPSRQDQSLLYTSPTLSGGNHSLTVRDTGAKNSSSQGIYIVADRVIITTSTSPNPTPSPTPTPPPPPPPPPTPSTGWINIINDQFNSGSLPSHWNSYTGRYNTNSGGNCVSPNHATVFGGYLHLLMAYDNSGVNASAGCTGNQWYTAGLTTAAPFVSQNMRVTMRWRIVRSGSVIGAHVMPERYAVASVWPDNEEDWCEGTNLSSCGTNFHYNSGTASKPVNSQVRLQEKVDLTQWHTMRTQRKGQQFTMWIDDMTKPVLDRTLTTEQAKPAVSRLILQLDCNYSYGCPTGHNGSEDDQIDWITVDTN